MSKFSQYTAIVTAKKEAHNKITYHLESFSIGPDSSGAIYLAKEKNDKKIDSINGITPHIAKFIIDTLIDIYDDDLHIIKNGISLDKK